MRRFACLSLALCLSSPALGQSSADEGSALPSPKAIAKRDMVTIGVGVAIIPDYEGSDDYHLTPVAAVRGKLGRISFSSRGKYLYVDFLPKSDGVDLNLCPIVGARFSNRRHIDDPVIRLLPRRKT